MSLRVQRVSAQLQRQVADALQAEVSGTAVLLTVTRVSVSPDLRQATVWVAGWDNITLANQERLVRLLQRYCNQRSTSKVTPRLTLETDTSADYAQNIQRLLHETESEL